MARWLFVSLALALTVPLRASAAETDGLTAHESTAHQEPPAGTPVVTRRDALRTGFRQGPDVAVASAPKGAVAEMRRKANPAVVQPATASMYGGYRWGMLGAGVEINANVVQTFSWTPLGRSRERSADALGALTDRSIDQARLIAGERALVAWVDLLEADAVHDLRVKSREAAVKLQKIARTRVDVGTGEPTEAALADGELGAAAAAELQAEGFVTEARLALRFALGMPPEGAIEAQGDLFAIAPIEGTGGGPLAERGTHPTVARAQAEALLAERDARLARANASPSFGVGATYQREGTSDQVVMGGVVLPLPFGDFGGYAEARQRAEADRLTRQVDRVKLELDQNRALYLHEREHSRATYAALVAGASKPYREALRLATLRYEKGPGDLATVLVAFERSVRAEETLVMAAADVQRADIRWASSTGALMEEAR